MKITIHGTHTDEGTAAEEAKETKAQEDKEPDKWEIENAADHIVKAEEIKQKPKLMNHVMVHLAGKQAAMNKATKTVKKITSLKQLKEIAHDKIKNGA